MLRYLRNLLSFNKTLRWMEEETWEESDRHELRAFLASTSGRRFSLLLRNMVLKHQASAVQQSGRLEWSCGRAHGFAAAAHLIDTLAQTPIHPQSQEKESEEDSPTFPAFAEQWRP